MPKPVSLAEAASLLGVTPQHVTRLARRGELAYVTTPLGRLYDRADLVRRRAQPPRRGRPPKPRPVPAPAPIGVLVVIHATTTVLRPDGPLAGLASPRPPPGLGRAAIPLAASGGVGSLAGVESAHAAETLGSLPRLLGAALALGAQRVPGVSSAERAACNAIGVVAPAPAELRRLRERITAGEDPLGDAFCRLRPPALRRADGATYTPAPIVAAMVEWARRGPSVGRVIDPGSGSARFAVAAGHAAPGAQVVAVELDPVAALVSRANLSAHGLADRARVVMGDFRELAPPPIDAPTLYIGNPPYVRHHRIAPSWKRWLTATARARGLEASQLAGLHVHFFLATAAGARPGDRGAYITSSEWLDVNYGALVRQLMLDGLGGTAIHVIAPSARPFDDAQTTAAITCFEIGSRPRSVRLRRVRSVASLGTLGGGRPVPRERLAAARRWTPLLGAARPIPEGHIELGELCRVHRGAVTGANRVWVVDPATTKLPARLLVRSVTRARELFAAGRALESTDALRAVVDLPRDLDELEVDERRLVERFLRDARRLGAHDGYIARARRSWWAVGLRRPAPILATYMARRPPAFVRNPAGARHINVAHGLYPRETLTDGVLDTLAECLRSSVTVGEGRTYGGGLTKFEPREMERLLVPRPAGS